MVYVRLRCFIICFTVSSAKTNAIIHISDEIVDRVEVITGCTSNGNAVKL